MTNSVFDGGSKTYLNACINWKEHSSNLYYEGYWKAASKLVEGIKINNIGIDSLVYPIVFLYRQYLELKLKYIIQDSRLLLGGAGNFPKKHNILNLWNIVNENILKIDKNIGLGLIEYLTQDNLKIVECIINDFSKYDPESMAFRYPKDKDGSNHLNGLTYINIGRLESQMQVLKSMLDKIDMAIDSLKYSNI